MVSTAIVSSSNDLYELGDVPELGHVPTRMLAQLIRPERFGEPRDAFKEEAIEVPELGPRDVLVYVMAAGVNYNNVWAAMGIPIDVIKARMKKGEKEPFHIGGSDASGVVWAVGKDVKNVKVGDDVVVHCGMWNHDDPWVLSGKDPMYAPTQIIWGYESNWGSFAQFTKVQDHQCVPKPARLTWEEAAAYMLVGATAYRMLHGWSPNVVGPDEPVLIWGGAGGLGSMAIQIARAAGARPVAVVSGDSKNEFCKQLGAVGVIDRRKFDHWGKLPRWSDDIEYAQWLKGARAFGAAFWQALGEKKNPTIVFEHPGETTLPTSCFMCETGGMVVICAGTTGYNATLDLRYHWMRQKRLQGSHFANDEQAIGINKLVDEGKVDPCLSRVFRFDETAECHQLMRDNKHPSGNMSILVNAPKPGLRTLDEVRALKKR
jgi:crotonyl-CoA carboxylase/reductase